MSIVLERLVKRYDRNVVVHHVSVETGDGEFFVLLRPSGSGKSTVLRMIAGLADVDEERARLRSCRWRRQERREERYLDRWIAADGESPAPRTARTWWSVV
jgi:ABC-type sugar transport system ATPase subunit